MTNSKDIADKADALQEQLGELNLSDSGEV